MLQDFRDNLNGVTKGVLVFIIIIPFALFGVDALFETRATAKEVANVNGDSISELNLQQAVLVRKQQISNMVEDADPSLFSNEILRPTVLQRLIRQKVEEQTASDLGMTIPKERIDALLVEVPEFKTDGRFDHKRYEFVVKQMGYTTNSHYKAIYSDFLAQQFLQGIVSTGFSTEKEQELIAAVSKQSRDYYYLTIPVESQKNSIEPSAEDINGYYEKHLADFMTSEQVMIEYIELRSSDLLKEISVDADLIEESYQEKIDIASSSTLYRAAHILLDRKDDGSHLAKMAAVQDQLKNNEDFSSLAIAYSDDFLTSEKGGDLGYLSPGDLSSELDLVLGQLSVGAVSEIVETKAGIHLLKLIEIKAVEIPNRDELEPSIRKDLQLQMAKDLMPEKIEELKELAYGNTSLVGVANTMGLDLKLSDLFSRSGGNGIVANKQVIEASFSSSALEDGYASDVIELSDDHVLVLSVREHSPSKVQPLSDVTSEIKQIIQYSIAADKLFSYGSKLKKRVASGEGIESVAKSENLPWQVSFNSKIDEKNAASDLKKMFIFSLPLPDDKPVVGHLIMPNGDYVLTALSKVTLGSYGTLRLAEKNLMSSSRSTATASRDYGAYISLLLEGADIASD